MRAKNNNERFSIVARSGRYVVRYVGICDSDGTQCRTMLIHQGGTVTLGQLETVFDSRKRT